VDVPLLDLKTQFADIQPEVRAAMDRVLESQHFILGPEVQALEEELAAYAGAAHGIGVSSGTDALLVSLLALCVGPGDEVITTPYSFFASAGCIVRLGAQPIFVDIEPDTFNIDADLIEAAITPRTKAILPVHLFGQCADMTAILEIANARGIPVIEDAAQAIGAEHLTQRAGSMGVLGCFSFFPSKNLGAFGDGGLVVSSDATLADKIRSLRSHGAKPKYHHTLVGGNFRLDALQAAVIRAKFAHLDEWTEKRQENADLYDEKFVSAGLAPELLTTPIRRPGRHIFNQYVLRTRERNGLMEHLKAVGVGCEVYYPKPLHLQECFEDLGYGKGWFPNAKAASGETLAIPVYPELTEGQIDAVVGTVVSYLTSV
jgi:dTDP-4-amino-4,6-dideoxygalactose transaminase